MKQKKGVLVSGYDLGLNHGAVIQLIDGKLNWFSYYTDLAGAASKHKDAYRLTVDKSKDNQLFNMLRLYNVLLWFEETIRDHAPDFAGVEDYALDASHGAHHKGELGGVARMCLLRSGIPFRLHDPGSVKMFVTGDGTAKKDLMEEFVLSRWGADFSQYNLPQKGKKQNRQTSEDLSDAYGVAYLVWTEYLIRTGQMMMSDLGNEKEIRVFNRVTKMYPNNILDREWIEANVSGDIRYDTVVVNKIHKWCRDNASKNPKLSKFILSLMES